MTLLAGIEGYCTGVACRHGALSEYFGQKLASESCGACDVCLDEVQYVADSLVISQKILSCVARVGENFGGEYVSLVLTGSRDERILSKGHDQLISWGLLAEHLLRDISDWIVQIVSQRFLRKTFDYNVLQLTEAGWQVLRGELTPRLLKPAGRKERQKQSRAALESWDGVDRDLFEQLRAFRRRKAEERAVPPFIVFSDATLRDLARVRPTTLDQLPSIHGIGAKKIAEYGADLLALITTNSGAG